MFWSEDDDISGLFDSLTGATSLPGIFSPFKKILRVLTTPRAGLLTKLDAAFEIADTAKRYIDAQDDDDNYIEESIDFAERWIEDNSYFAAHNSYSSGELIREILQPCVKGLKRERIKIKDDAGNFIATEIILFTYKVGDIVDTFVLRFELQKQTKEKGGITYPTSDSMSDEQLLRFSTGPYFHIREDDETPKPARLRFNNWVAQAFWAHYGSSFIEIDFVSDYPYQDSRPIITAELGKINYIATGGTLSEVEEVANSARLFLDAGFSRSIMLLGPPGVGKTTLTRVINTQLGGRCVILRPSFFKGAGAAGGDILTMLSPNVIVFDDFDRYDVDNRLLLSMLEYLPKRLAPVIIIATVNDITRFDRATLRAGRFDELVYVPEPDADGRLKIFDYYNEMYSANCNKQLPPEAHFEIIEHIKNDGAGMTPADIAELVKTITVLGPRLFMVKFKALERQRRIYRQIFDDTEALWFNERPVPLKKIEDQTKTDLHLPYPADWDDDIL